MDLAFTKEALQAYYIPQIIILLWLLFNSLSYINLRRDARPWENPLYMFIGEILIAACIIFILHIGGFW